MSKKSETLSLVQDVIIAIVVVVVILAALWSYGGRWPPMVVVESESMQHSHTESSVGVIDTGDLTLVRTLDKAGPIVTWVEGRETGHRTYGEYGDVVVYHKNGLSGTTPIIHRAIVRIVYNATGGGFDIPDLDRTWNVKRSFRIDGFHSYHNGRREVISLEVNVSVILNNFKANNNAPPHSGIITKGDHNRDVDQHSLPAYTGPGAPPVGTSGLVEPVRDVWVVGVARGEIPWFGLIKLWVKGQTDGASVPENSGDNLILSVILLLVGPFLGESVYMEYRKLRPKKEEPRRGGKRRRGEPEEERESIPSFIVNTLRDALKGKVR
jgi:signal peptidase